MKSFNVIAYLVYLPIVLTLTFFVAQRLFKNSMVFMTDIFNGRIEIAQSTNNLFKIGFYLLNMGFALFILRIDHYLASTQHTIEILSLKVGGFSIYLGVMLFANLYLFFRGKKASKQKQLQGIL